MLPSRARSRRSCVAACSTGWPGNNGGDPPPLVLRADGEVIEIGPHSYSTRTMAAGGTTLPADGPAAVVDTEDVVSESPRGRVDIRRPRRIGGRRQLTADARARR